MWYRNFIINKSTHQNTVINLFTPLNGAFRTGSSEEISWVLFRLRADEEKQMTSCCHRFSETFVPLVIRLRPLTNEVKVHPLLFKPNINYNKTPSWLYVGCVSVNLNLTGGFLRLLRSLSNEKRYLRFSIIIFTSFEKLGVSSVPKRVLVFHISFRPREVP